MRFRRYIPLLLPLLATAACDALDPYKREGNWRPAQVNEANLAVMVANPAELRRGTGAPGTAGFVATGAIERLRADRVKPLPDTGLARIITVPSGNSGSGN
ncbi:hypothetical protein [Paracraurococcus lichenis]|uniref:Uncharacterized protein n=1 Tax=Paracraurococcus lichenis TaxID=3064888 RepID=A0ABT9DZ09_9PROT|nr:hypothetical protein [Paracraurococcus sp. LOR1-02]MDO9709135.1 hypothetical protein [Paracraurococcus sp. LOR1-02]